MIDAVAPDSRGDLVERGDRVRGLERAQDALAAREAFDRGERVVVRARDVVRRARCASTIACSGPTPG